MFSRELVDRMMMTTVTMMMTTVTLVMTTVIGTENTQEKFFPVRAGRWHGWKLFSIYNWFKSAEKRNISLKDICPLGETHLERGIC